MSSALSCEAETGCSRERRIVVMEQVSEVGGGLVVEGFVSEEKGFKMYALRDRERMERMEDRGDVVTVADEHQNSLCTLGVWITCQMNAVVAVDFACDEGMDQGFSSREGENKQERTKPQTLGDACGQGSVEGGSH